MPTILSQSFCQAVEKTLVTTAMAEHPYFFPTVETLHLVSMIVLVGSISAFDLRLLGVSLGGGSVSRLARRLLPATWVAFAMMSVTGALMFASNPVMKYCNNPALQIKLALILLAGANMGLFHFTVYHRVEEWDTAPSMPLGAKLAGSLSVFLWAGVVVAGRWIGFA